jgi:uncharacterized protein
MRAVDEIVRPPTDGEVTLALRQFAVDVRRRYGARLRGLYLFGSRARGDHKPDSDVDVAVILDAADLDLRKEKWVLVDLAFEPGFGLGLHISPWPFADSEWVRSEELAARPLVRNARREALPVMELS